LIGRTQRVLRLSPLAAIQVRDGLGGVPAARSAGGSVLVVVFYLDRFKVFGFKNLAAIETFDVIDAIAAGDNLGVVVITGGLHKTALY
jgi:hypothetical protein